MPNHIKNLVTIQGTEEQVNEVINKFGTHHKAELNRTMNNSIICQKKNSNEFSVGWFNEKTGVFNRSNEENVIGLPEGWEMEITPEYIHFPDFEKVIPQPENIFRGNLGKEEEEMCKAEGRPTWYEWNIANWGTKWNSYSCKKVNNNSFFFETAWSSVLKIMTKISTSFPEIEFLYEFADEDTGYNAGMHIIKNGIAYSNIPEGGSKEAYEIAFKLRPDIREYYVLVNGNYENKE